MALTVFLIFIVCLIGGLWWFRRAKRRDHSSNRYRHYHARSSKPLKMRHNRYHHSKYRPTKSEIKTGTKVEAEAKAKIGTEAKKAKAKAKIETGTETETKIEILEKNLEQKNVEPKKRAELPSHSDDPDVVLGLKEAPENIHHRKPIPTEAQITLKPPPLPPPVITFFVMAEEGKPFNGYELLQAILSVGARFGKHHIFHRHKEKTGHGPVLFSIASATKPGTFDLSKMGGFSTPGLSLFFCASDVDDPITVYELMLQTSGQLMEDLGGRVFDEHRQLLTPTTIVNQRRLLRDYLQDQQQEANLFETITEDR